MQSYNFLSPLVQKKLKELQLSADEVIRKALNIKGEGFEAGDGVFLPEGSVLLGWYKDKFFEARVKEGELLTNGESCASISAAAGVITGRPTTNGWDFWISVKFPGKNEMLPLKSLRKSAK